MRLIAACDRQAFRSDRTLCKLESHALQRQGISCDVDRGISRTAGLVSAASGPAQTRHRSNEASRLRTFRRCPSGWASTLRRGVNWSVTLASCHALLRVDLSRWIRSAAIARIGDTIFAAEPVSYSHRSDAIAKPSSSLATIACIPTPRRATQRLPTAQGVRRLR